MSQARPGLQLILLTQLETLICGLLPRALFGPSFRLHPSPLPFGSGPQRALPSHRLQLCLPSFALCHLQEVICIWTDVGRDDNLMTRLFTLNFTLLGVAAGPQASRLVTLRFWPLRHLLPAHTCHLPLPKIFHLECACLPSFFIC